MLSYRAALIVCFALVISKAFAQETLMTLDHVWRYEGSGGDLGMAWRDVTYDDSTWPQGAGVLAREENPVVTPLIKTELTRVGTNGAYKVIDYFRTRFHVSDVRPRYFLSAAVLVDDGAVAYLNGVELFRVRMPPGPIDANTLGTETIDAGREGVFVTTNVVSAALQAGENVLTVEVHQPYITSSDVTWGMVLTYAPIEPVSIVEQPRDLTIEEGKPVTFAVKVRGTLPRFQWWKGAELLTGKTNASLSLPMASRTDAGQYWVAVSNDVSVVASRLATLTVVLDREPPRLNSAEAAADSIRLNFSEALDAPSANDVANYRLVTANGQILPITSAWYQPHTVFLQIPPLVPGRNHYLYVSNVRDLAGNVIPTNSGASVATLFTNIPVGSIWKYNDSGVAPEADWNQISYDDSQWPVGAALLYNDVNLTLQPPAVRNTLIAVTNANGTNITHYFRLNFTNVISPFGSFLEFSHYVDDGAVFYLNGGEVRRFNMPSGTIEHLTRASASATEGAFNGGFSVHGTNVLTGQNMLAVDVHQFSLTSPNFPDLSFALQCQARVQSFVNSPAAMLQQPEDMTVRENATAVFLATVAAAESLQWLRDGLPIPGAVAMTYTNMGVTPDQSGTGFALVASNAFGMITSRTARLTVIPDLTPPRLLSADMGTNVDRLVLSFSEVLNPASLTGGSFVISNVAGGILSVLNAEIVSGTNIVLTTAPRTAGDRYVVAVRNIVDTALTANVLHESSIGVAYEHVLVRYDSLWKYDDTGTNYSNAWREPSFDDSAWPSGPGLLGFEDSPLLPLPILTILPPPEFRGPAYFFRTHFSFVRDPASTILRLRHIVDDGVVVFLNAQEVHRVRVPVGQNAATVADSQVQDGTIEGPFIISSDALVNGDNVLAAQVHQVTVASADSVFGLELTQAFLPVPPWPASPRLDLEWGGGELVLSWDAWDFVLECAPSLTGPWIPVSQPTIPYAITPEDSARFFRLRKGL